MNYDPRSAAGKLAWQRKARDCNGSGGAKHGTDVSRQIFIARKRWISGSLWYLGGAAQRFNAN